MIRAVASKASPVGVLTKLLRLVEAFDSAPEGLHLRDIARESGVNKSTAYRLLVHMAREGYLFRNDAGVYFVSPKLARLGAGTYHAALLNFSRPVMQRLWRRTGETVNLGVLDGLDVLYLDVIESPQSFRLVSPAGMRRPLHCTALGKGLLAFAQPEKRETVIRSLRLERVSPRTIVSEFQLREQLARAQQTGYATDDEECDAGARCVSAPIFDAGGRPIAAISVSGPVTRISHSTMLSFARAVREGALEISEKLGFVPSARRRSFASRTKSF